MKIWCTVLRKNGSYKTVPVKAGKRSFELDKNSYQVTGFFTGRFLGFIPVLRAVYMQGYTFPLEKEMIEGFGGKFKIDTKAIKNVTNKKILDVFGDRDLTTLEEILILIACASIGVGVVNLIMIFQLMEQIGVP